MIGQDHSLTGGLISAATLVVVVQVVGYFAWRFRAVEKFVEGIPRILVRHGKVKDTTLRQEQVTMAELIEAIRREGHSSVTSIRFAILETDGSITMATRQSGKASDGQ